jgi:hypothetical protein
VNTFDYILAALIGTLSAARITRLITWDKFPPSVRIRMLWDRLTGDGEWSLLFHCPWCMGFWVTGGVALWGHLSGYDFWWWTVNSIFGLSYVAAMIVIRDGDDD